MEKEYIKVEFSKSSPYVIQQRTKAGWGPVEVNSYQTIKAAQITAMANYDADSPKIRVINAMDGTVVWSLNPEDVVNE